MAVRTDANGLTSRHPLGGRLDHKGKMAWRTGTNITLELDRSTATLPHASRATGWKHFNSLQTLASALGPIDDQEVALDVVAVAARF